MLARIKQKPMTDKSMNTQQSIPASSGALRIGAGSSLFLFICWWLLAWIFGAVIITKTGSSTVSLLRLSIVLQDVIIFILPAVMTALLIARRPWGFIKVDKTPGVISSAMVLLTILTAIPAMNMLVKWNEGLHLPESMAALENFLRDAEASAGATISMLLGEVGIADMLISLLLIGILTGIAEEVFFRGALQSILRCLFRNHHLAIWTTAFVFSAIHMQFFGFFPRLLMGAFFGYLVWWSGSLWLSVIAHAVNNSLVVLSMWLIKTGRMSTDINSVGTTGTPVSIALVVGSIILTALLIYLLHRSRSFKS